MITTTRLKEVIRLKDLKIAELRSILQSSYTRQHAKIAGLREALENALISLETDGPASAAASLRTVGRAALAEARR